MFTFINNILKNDNIYKTPSKNIILYISVLILIQGFISHYLFYKIEFFNGPGGDTSKPFKWTTQLLHDFLTIQQLMNPEIVFDTNIIQQQVTPDEMEFFFKNKYFYWSENTKKKYIYLIDHNPTIRVNAENELNRAQSIYNENAILQFLYIRGKLNKNNPQI